jgi:hypothetical protein
MTSIRLPFVSPYPFDCPDCDAEVTESKEQDQEVYRDRYRIIHIQCESCDQKNRIKQQPLFPDYEVVEE